MGGCSSANHSYHMLLSDVSLLPFKNSNAGCRQTYLPPREVLQRIDGDHCAIAIQVVTKFGPAELAGPTTESPPSSKSKQFDWYAREKKNERDMKVKVTTIHQFH